MSFNFCHFKATQALNYFAISQTGNANKLKALKLVFFADRHHFRMFGRPIIGDNYYALKFGPVASGTKDIIDNSTSGLADEERKYADNYLKPTDNKLHNYRSIRKVDTSVFSKTDLISLDWSWQKFGKFKPFDLAELTHNYPEWKRHEAALTSKFVSRCEMNYADFLEDPETDAYFEKMDPTRKHDILDMLKEQESIYKVLCS